MIVRQARVEDAAGIARVRVDSWRTTYKGIVPDDYLTNMSYEESERRWRWILNNGSSTGSICYVVEEETGQVVGFISGGPEREHDDPAYSGELYAIYVLKEYQEQGIGRRLTETLVEKLLQAGMESMLVWVLAENPACRFYEALGGQPLKTVQEEIGGKLLDLIGYGWSDIKTLLPEPS
jgi:ribosomal protein S18 acetylase RimI-like enzyme